jgi:hypothetical protein
VNGHLVGIIAHIAAAQARIEAMKATNHSREENGHSHAYGEEDFWYEANNLEQLAIEAKSVI